MNNPVMMDDMLAERRTGNDFRWATKSWNPSGYFLRGKHKTPREIVEFVLNSKPVMDAIHELCAKEGKPVAELKKQASQILTEMAHDYHVYAVRWFAIMLSKISKRLFITMQVNTSKMDQIRQAFLSYPVILLPTHRSYVDFLLVSYTFFHYDLPLPVIAAGMDFMGMVGIGEMLRRSGAFFIRRRFGGDKLYWALIKEYVKTCALSGGHPIEMFVEGTRSRSGKTISPKIGLLSTLLEMVWNADVPDVLILPISMSYDRTLEETLYAHELLGTPKPKESTNGLVRALRWLPSQCYGGIYMNFGDLISVREFVDQVRPRPLPLNGEFSEMVQEIALKTVMEHQKHMVVPMFPIVSAIVLAEVSIGKTEIALDHLFVRMSQIRQILASRENIVGLPDPEKSWEDNIHLILHVHAALVKFRSLSSTVSPVLSPNETVQVMQFQHYANQLLPLILPCCITALMFLECPSSRENIVKVTKNPDAAEIEDVVNDYTFYRLVLQEDFPYEHGAEKMELIWAATTLQNAFAEASRPESDSQPTSLMHTLKSAIDPYIIAYWGTFRTLLELSCRTTGPCSPKQLSKTCQGFLEQTMKSTSYLPKHYGALSLDTLNNAVLSTALSNATAKVKLADGSFGIVVKDKELLRSSQNRLAKILKIPDDDIQFKTFVEEGKEQTKNDETAQNPETTTGEPSNSQRMRSKL